MISCYNITVVLVVRLIPLPINSKKKCKDAKKSLTARQAGKIDAFTGSIPAIYIRCTTRSQRSNNAKSSPSPHPTPLCHCLPAKEWLSILVRGRGVCMCVWRQYVCVLDLPASDEQSVLYRGHQLKVKAMLGLVARGPASEYRVPPWNCSDNKHAINGRLMVKADSDVRISHPVLIKHIFRYGNYVHVDSTTILYILYSLSNQTCASLQCFCVFDNGCLCQHTTLLFHYITADWFYYSGYGMLASKVWTWWEGGGASVCLKSL